MQLVCLLTPTRALAEPKLFVELDYRTDPALKGCPNEVAFRSLVQEQLGFNPFRVGAEQKVVARAFRGDGEVSGFVRWYDASGAERGERQLRSANNQCAAFVRELGFAVVVQIQLLAEAIREKEPAPSESTPATGSEPSSPAVEKERQAPPPAPVTAGPGKVSLPAQASPSRPPAEVATRWQVSAGVGPALSFGLLPRMAVQGRAFMTLRRNWLALELGADTSLRVRSSEDDDGRGFESSMSRLSLAGCGFASPFSACLVSHWGRLTVHGFGVEVPRVSSGLFAQLGVRLGLAGELTESFLGALWAEGLISLSSWDVSLNDREAWSVPRFGIALGVDLAAVFHDNQ